MLSDQFYAQAEKIINRLYGNLEEDILRDVARRIVKNGDVTDSAQWQIAKLQEAGMVYDDVIEEIARISRKSESVIRGLFEAAGLEALDYDDTIYRLAGLKTTPLRQSPALIKVLEAGYIKTKGLLQNLTLTTANMTQTAYINACDTAYMQVISGAFSPQTAIRNAIVQAAGSGTFVLYPSGHRDHLDVAIRRATLTGLTQTTMQLQMARMDELGVDLVEVSAHAGARPEHTVWQGRIYSRSGKHPKYPDFVSSTGYGTGAGLGGWNCRHSFYPFFEGISKPAYSEAELKNYEKMNSFEYDEKTYTQYEGNQKQRYYEREIRKTKRELVGLEEGIKAAKTIPGRIEVEADFLQKSVILKRKEQKLKDFLRASGQRNEKDRQQVYGFNQSVSGRAVWGNRRFTKVLQGDIIYNSKQVGKKLGKHCSDFGLNPSSERDREIFKGIINDISNNAEEIRVGEWRGQEDGPCFYKIWKDDVVIVNINNEYISILRGGISNARIKKGRRLPF